MHLKPRQPHEGVLINALLWANRLGRFALFVALVAALYFAYRYSIHILINGSAIFGALVLWALTAYVTLPRIHRWLTKLYLPDYYVGRIRTGDGILSDPINIAVIGSARELRMAMEAAGWVQAERITPRSVFKMIHSSLLGTSYPHAPVYAAYLFGRRQTFAFQKEVDGNPRKRHHVRFWRTPQDWWLPGGHAADWLGAATFDTNIGLSLFTGQFTHRIAEDIDEERDFVVADLRAVPGARVEVVEHFTSGFHARNGYGDRMRTDGSMPFVHLS